MKNKTFQAFTIPAGTYHYTFYVVIGTDYKRIVKYIKSKRPTSTITEKDFDRLGFAYVHNEYCPVMWVPRIPKTPKEHGTLNHEIFHMICDLARWAGLYLNEGSEEAFCHLIGHVTEQFYKKAK